VEVIGYFPSMAVGRLILLIAVLLMPLGMSPAAASGGGREAARGMPAGHCDEQTPRHHSKAGFSECTMACSAALPAVGSAPQGPLPVARMVLRSSLVVALHGLEPDIATPPPKDA
jgi:hypothetical protein